MFLGYCTLLGVLGILFVSSFEHVNFAIIEKHSKKFMTIQIIMLPL
jgi:hypothetical protein